MFVQFAVASDSIQIQFKNIAADFIDEHQIRTHVAIAESLEFSMKLMVSIFPVKFFAPRERLNHFPGFLPFLFRERFYGAPET